MKACYFGQEEVMNDLIFRYRCDLTITSNGTNNSVSIFFMFQKLFIIFLYFLHCFQPGKTLLESIRLFFGTIKYEQVHYRIINELGELGEQGTMHGHIEQIDNGAIEEENINNDENLPANSNGLHAFSYIHK